MINASPAPWLFRESSKSDMQINGTEAWDQVFEIISAPEGTDAVSALFVGFTIKREDASAIAFGVNEAAMVKLGTSDRNRTIFHQFVDGKRKTDIAKEHGISKSQIAQIIWKIMRKLRSAA